jgi:uncharacterized membrane protein YbhN (UPF0104 family)
VVKIRKKGLTALKIVVSAALLYFIFTKINFEDVAGILKRTNPFYLFVALLLFVVSKVLAAFRLNLYFNELKVLLTQKSNLKLYLLGMFYNLFLPGGIGGDAYKGYLINKNFEVETKKVVSVLVLDRLSGLLLLFVYACIIGTFINTYFLKGYEILFGFAAIASIVIFWFLNKRLFGYALPVFWKSFGYSALVQLAQLASVLCILKALSIQLQTAAYLFIFLLSSIVSVLPITIGGIGSREVTFLYGAQFLGLDENTSVGISMTFFLITALVSLSGVVFHFKKPGLEIKTS